MGVGPADWAKHLGSRSRGRPAHRRLGPGGTQRRNWLIRGAAKLLVAGSSVGGIMPARRCGKENAPQSLWTRGKEVDGDLSFWGSGGWLRCLRRSYLHLLEHVLCRASGKIEELFCLLGRLSCKFLEELSVQFQCFW